MDFIDYYKTLGIDKTASQDQIKAAYRKLARKYHPDLNPNDKDANKKFQQINEANEVLSDPENRKKYDQYGKDWQHAEAFEKAGQRGGGTRGGARRPGAGGPGTGGAGADDFGNFGDYGEYTYSRDSSEEGFSDFFESLFGGAGGGNRSGRRSQAKFKGNDYQASLQLNLEDAYTTHQQTFQIDGKSIRITVPAGVVNGQVIKLKGYGSAGVNGGPAGDLYITFSIAPHPRYRRDGDDLYTTESIDLYTAVLGGEVTIDTLSGKVKLKLKPGTQNGIRTRLREKGFPVYKNEGKYGDLYVSFEVKLPTDLSEKEKELFTELAGLRKR